MENILVAPLNWGLGHATRCIPIIKALEEQGFNPIIASDGVALALLKKEFPHLISVELPGYNISYSENVQIGIYDVGNHYEWHVDWDPFTNLTHVIRKISLVCLLNDSSEFEGGEFEFEFGEKLKLEQGTIIAFPSFLSHKVHPVTKGTRISAVSWIVGDPTF